MNISPLVDEMQTLSPSPMNTSNKAMNAFMLQYNNNDKWIDINYNMDNHDEYFSHASSNWSACMVLDCLDHKTYMKS